MSHVQVFRHYIPSSLLLLGVLEFVLLFGCLVAGASLRFGGFDSIDWRAPWPVVAGLFSFVLIACTVAMGVYSATVRQGSVAMLVRTLVSYCFLGIALLTIIYYLLPSLFVGRGVLAISVILSIVVVVPFRMLFVRVLSNEQIQSRALVLGIGSKAQKLTERLSAQSKSVVNIIAYVNPADFEPKVAGKVVSLDRPLKDIARAFAANEIIVAMDERRKSDGVKFPLDQLFDCKQHGIRVSESITIYERELSVVDFDEIRASWLVFSAGFTNSTLWSYIKRLSDLLIASCLLLLVWPLMLIGMMAIFLETGRPVLYSQLRVGRLGKPFRIYKFRSMTVDAEKGGKAQWASANDNRITRVGAFLRNTRIDELPQLWNVLRGDMSFVGPRPERPEFVEQLAQELPYYNERHLVKPGLMGWAQLNYPYGASVEDAAEKLRYDLYYVKNRSILLDVIILVQTVQIILLGEGVR